MGAEPALTVVLPAYREADNLRLLLPRLNDVLRRGGETFELLVVDAERSLDDTFRVCEENGARCLPRAGGSRYGDAVRSGIAASRGRHVLFMDADGSHPPELIPALLAQRGRADVAVASRYAAGGRSENGLASRLMSMALNRIYAAALGLPCRDVSNSFKLYRGDQLRALRLESGDFDVIEEILAKLAGDNPALKIVEVPFVFRKRIHGRTKRNLPLLAAAYLGTLARLWSRARPASSRGPR